MGLISFLVKDWRKECFCSYLSDKTLYVTCGEECFKYTSDALNRVTELFSNQEEADSRVIFHAYKISLKNRYKSLIICSDDTDVLIILLAFSNTIKIPIYQKVTSKTKLTLINVSAIATALGENLCSAIVGLHSFTGTDSTSAFASKGKIGALKIINHNVRFQNVFEKLGEGIGKCMRT